MDQQRRAETAQDRGSLARSLGRIRGDAHVERLALPDGGVEGAHRLFERSLRIEPVGIEDVDVVETHPAEALVEAGQEVLARSADAIGSGPHVVAGLGRDDQLVAIGCRGRTRGCARSSPPPTRAAGRSCCRSRNGSRRDRMPAARWRAGCRADGRRRSSATGRGRSRAEGDHSSRPADRPSSRTDPGRHRAAMSSQQAIRRLLMRARRSAAARRGSERSRFPYRALRDGTPDRSRRLVPVHRHRGFDAPRARGRFGCLGGARRTPRRPAA